jgi:hypothetical protein
MFGMLWVIVMMYVLGSVSNGFVVMESLLRTKIAHESNLEVFKSHLCLRK